MCGLSFTTLLLITESGSLAERYSCPGSPLRVSVCWGFVSHTAVAFKENLLMAPFQDGCLVGWFPANYSLGYSVRLVFRSRWCDSTRFPPHTCQFKSGSLLEIQSKTCPAFNPLTPRWCPLLTRITALKSIRCMLSSRLSPLGFGWVLLQVQSYLLMGYTQHAAVCVHGCTRKTNKKKTHAQSTGRLWCAALGEQLKSDCVSRVCVCMCIGVKERCLLSVAQSWKYLSDSLQDNDFPCLFPWGRFCHGLYHQHCARGLLMGMLNLLNRVHRGHLIHGVLPNASPDNHTRAPIV